VKNLKKKNYTVIQQDRSFVTGNLFLDTAVYETPGAQSWICCTNCALGGCWPVRRINGFGLDDPQRSLPTPTIL